MRPLVLDTNAALLPFSQGCDLEDLWELAGSTHMVVPSSVDRELRTHAAGLGALARQAQAALRLLADAPREASDLPGDDGVLDVARRLHGIIVTNDRGLHDQAARQGVPSIAAKRDGRFGWVRRPI